MLLPVAPHRPQLSRHALIVMHAGAVGAVAAALLVAAEETYPSSVSLSVSAVILKKVWIRTESSPPALVLTDADVARGFIDVPAPTVITLRNNSEDGFLFRFGLDANVASSARVTGLTQPVHFGQEGAMLAQPGRFRTEKRLELRWRLQLAQGITPGQHPWPVQIQVEAN